MEWGPDWIPSLDGINTLPDDGSLVEPGIEVAISSAAALNPQVIAAIKVIGIAVASEKVVEKSKQANKTAREYIEEHENPADRREAYKIKLAEAVSKVLPGCENLDALDETQKIDLFSEYIENETWQSQANRRIEALLTGDFETLALENQEPDEVLLNLFDADNEEEAIAHLFNLQDLITMQATFETKQEVESVANDVEELKNDLERFRDTVQSNARQQLSIQIENQGFYRVTPLYLDEYTPNPETAWQRPFYLSEVRNGYAAERIITDTGNNRESGRVFNEDLISRLQNGTDIRLIGRPGSGKSTVCKQVINTWYNEAYGPVLYRPSGRSFEKAGDLYEYVTSLAGQGHVLVIVEDALRDHTRDILDVVARLSDRSDVSFLLETRQLETDHEMDIGFDHGTTRGQQLVTHLNSLETVQMPVLSVDEIEAIIDRFEAKTGEQIPDPASDLYEAIETEAGIGETLLLGYLLRGGKNEGMTALERDVRSTLSVVEQRVDPTEAPWKHIPHDNGDLVRDLILYINMLNTLGRAITKDTLIAFDPDQERRIIETLDAFDGWILFNEVYDNNTIGYTMYHDQWSFLYIEELFRSAPSLTRIRIGQGLEAIGRYLKENMTEEKRESLTWSVSSTDSINPTLDSLTEVEFATLKFTYIIASEHPKLIPLLGTETTYITDYIECSEAVEVAIISSCIQGYFGLGTIEKAVAHHEAAWKRIKRIDEDLTALRISLLTDKAFINQHLSHYEKSREDIKKAEKLLENGDLADKENLLAQIKLATTLGGIQHRDDEPEEAIKTLESAQTMHDRIEYPHLEIQILNRLANAKMDVGKYDDADRHLEQALTSIKGAAHSKRAITYGNRARLASFRGNPDQGVSDAKRAITLYQQLGDQVGEARAHQNLSSLLLEDEQYDEAVEEVETAISLFKQTKEPRGLSNSFHTLTSIHHEHSDGAVDKCQIYRRAADTFEELGFQEFRTEFRRLYKREEVNHPNVGSLFKAGLRFIHDSKDARPILKEAWRRRKLHQTDCTQYLFALRSGLALSAYEALHGYEPTISEDELKGLFSEVHEHLGHKDVCKGLADALLLRKPTVNIIKILNKERPRSLAKRQELTLAKETIDLCVFEIEP